MRYRYLIQALLAVLMGVQLWGMVLTWNQNRNYIVQVTYDAPTVAFRLNVNDISELIHQSLENQKNTTQKYVVQPSLMQGLLTLEFSLGDVIQVQKIAEEIGQRLNKSLKEAKLKKNHNLSLVCDISGDKVSLLSVSEFKYPRIRILDILIMIALIVTMKYWSSDSSHH